MIIKGYRYSTKTAAEAAQDELNEHFGFPDDGDTVQAVGVEKHDGKWYIRWDPTYASQLGDPTEYELPDPLPPEA
tara:strand:+ start:1287 stop:1511 length:225 start_codon:yes stop_codon:yes gene_type:complete